jgi:hypothetical protein
MKESPIMKMTTMRGKSRKTLTAADTIFPVAFGISPTGVIRKTFHSNLPETGKHGWDVATFYWASAPFAGTAESGAALRGLHEEVHG